VKPKEEGGGAEEEVSPLEAISQAVSRRLPTAAARVQFEVRSYGFFAGQNGTGCRFSLMTFVSTSNSLSDKCPSSLPRYTASILTASLNKQLNFQNVILADPIKIFSPSYVIRE
jgi:hypothetical protein